MNIEEKSSIRIIRKIIFISIIVILILAAGVFATKSDVNYITIKFSDDTTNDRLGEKINRIFYETAMLNYDEELGQEINAEYYDKEETIWNFSDDIIPKEWKDTSYGFLSAPE